MGILTRKNGPKGRASRPGLRERLAARRKASPGPPTARPRARRQAKPGEPLTAGERVRRAGILGGCRPQESSSQQAPLSRPPFPGDLTPSSPVSVRPGPYDRIIRMLRDPAYRKAVKAELEQKREAVRSRQAARLARAKARKTAAAPA
ncbi:MAG: hypothetical protein KIT79_12545 [Deltaproteobacteria bacterium]|nr:hypothetical protein [Deltaproteobacteria bacterium]